jgi:hypothetical protein
MKKKAGKKKKKYWRKFPSGKPEAGQDAGHAAGISRGELTPYRERAPERGPSFFLPSVRAPAYAAPPSGGSRSHHNLTPLFRRGKRRACGL